MGVVGGLATMVAMGILTGYTIMLLVWSKRIVASQTMARRLTYVDLGNFSWSFSCPRSPRTNLILFLPFFLDPAQFCFKTPVSRTISAIFIFFLMVFSALGCSAAYLVFVGDTLNSVWPVLSAQSWQFVLFPAFTLLTLIRYEAWFILIQFLGMWSIPTCSHLPLLVPPCRNYKYLALTSSIGNAALLFGLISVLVYGFTYRLEQFQNFSFEGRIFRPETFFLSFGSVAFLFACQFLILPIERSAARPREFQKPLTVSFITITISNAAFALISYMFFGDGEFHGKHGANSQKKGKKKAIITS
jgi:uncharacterized membrane protein YpjA